MGDSPSLSPTAPEGRRPPSRWAALAFEQFRTSLHRFLLSRLRSAQNAEDLAQEVYLRLLRVADAKQVRCPQAYVYRIAYNVLYEFKLREKAEPAVFDSQIAAQATELLHDEAAMPDEIYEEGDKERQFERMLTGLPPMQRAVLRLAAQHDLSHAQIAQKLGISVSTVRNHLYKAIDRCRHRFEVRP